MRINLKTKYKPLYTSKKRYFILTGGRGSGKTFAVQDFLVRLLEEVGQGILYTRYTLTSVEKTIMPLFSKHIELISSRQNYNITKTFIENKRTGSFILFAGIKTSSGDQTGNLKTLPNITTWVIEEGEDYNKEDSFVDIDDSIRSDKVQNRVIWIQNPTTKQHFIYKKFFKNSHEFRKIDGVDYQHCTHPRVEHIHTTFFDNEKNINPEKVKEWKYTKHSNPRKYANKYIGAWLDKAEGVIFEHWEYGEFDETLPYCFGLDWGYAKDPNALVKVAIDSKKKILYIDEKLYKKGLSTDEIAGILQKTCNKSMIVADSSELRLINELRVKDINIYPVVKKPGSVDAGIKKILNYKIVITKTSTNIANELNNYAWVDKGSKTLPVDDFNHAIDAVRYAMTRMVTE